MAQRTPPPQPKLDLSIKVEIKHKGKIIGFKEVAFNDDIMDMRNRDFQLNHWVSQDVGVHAVTAACKTYDSEK